MNHHYRPRFHLFYLISKKVFLMIRLILRGLLFSNWVNGNDRERKVLKCMPTSDELLLLEFMHFLRNYEWNLFSSCTKYLGNNIKQGMQYKSTTRVQKLCKLVVFQQKHAMSWEWYSMFSTRRVYKIGLKQLRVCKRLKYWSAVLIIFISVKV